MFATASTKNSLEVLEARIAPASAIATAKFIPAVVGGATYLTAGEGLGTATENSGTYLMYVEKGSCIVFTTDFNNNGAVDFNEITGIAAGDGLRLISFVNINGDIVTNLKANGTLSDSDNNSSNDDPFLKGDGRVVLNSTIESITLRSLTANDLGDQNNDGVIDDNDVSLRLALSSYSIFGSVYAGKGFGVHGDKTSGLIIDDTGRALQSTDFGTALGSDYFYDFKPTIGFIKTGTAVSGDYFNFGNSGKRDTQGLITNFIPPSGQAGGDIVGVKAATAALTFNIDGLIAGDGATGSRGGNIEDVTLNGDSAGGYTIQAGNGGRGANGGAGGSIVNFQDLSSFTGQVVIHSGDGGVASTGVGGNGGNISLGTININGGLGITLGNGGAGFSAGGNGASLAKAVLTTPEGGIVSARTIISTVHDPLHDPSTGLATTLPQIGRSMPLDFNHDGFGDMVFTTANPDQVVVVFGDGSGYFVDPTTALAGQFARINLPSPGSPDALTVGDFNGDGFYDIATASNDAGNFGGLQVYLAKTEDTNQDGILSKAEDLNHNGTIDFLGFQDPRYSPLPSLNRGDPDGGIDLIPAYSYVRSAVPISSIAAGDFNGDGITDIAVAAIETDKVTLIQRPVVMFMTANIENGHATGTFFADVGTKATSTPPQGANPLVPFFFLEAGTNAIIEATALNQGVDTHDFIVAETYASSKSSYTLDNSTPSIFGPLVAINANPTVDTSRGPGVNIVATTPQDFVISDTNHDGHADFTMITSSPNDFVVASVGNGNGGLTPVIGSGGDDTGADLQPLGTLLKIRNTNTPLSQQFDRIVIEYVVTTPPVTFGLKFYNIADGPAGNNGDSQLTGTGGFTPLLLPNTTVDSIRAMDIWIPNITANPTNVQYLIGIPTLTDLSLFNGILSTASPLIPLPEVEHYIHLETGAGGDALVGKGGIGGNIGDPLAVKNGTNPVTGAVVTTALDLVDITLPINRNFNALVDFVAGRGGNGFSAGGKGGGISSTLVQYPTGTATFHSIVSLTAGDGGFGVAGPGGAGGDLTGNIVQSGEFFTAGNGGSGAIGGAGGSIRGNGNTGVFDSEDLFNILHAGSGGNGAKAGGAGGDIVNFRGLYDLFIAGDAAGLLQHIAGNGGNAIAGPGGRGGNVFNSSPQDGQNNLAGDIILMGGNGGNGRTGGNGGSVMNFIDRPSESDNPAVLAFIAGNGGNGTSGQGGNGGSLAGIQTPSVGKPNPLSDLFFDPRITPMPYTYNRFLAGDGGKSSGGTGGNGGGVQDITTSNSDNPFVMVSGAGGSGLFTGGNGGDLKNVVITLGAESLNKALFIAGAGGSAASWKANPLDNTTVNQANKFFGGRIGHAGNGGSIVNLTQDGAIGARVDIIAGNGGDLINYGSVADSALPVGKGGSVTNVHVAGNIGNIAPNVPFKSYNDVLGGETLQHFVTVNLRDPNIPGSFDDNAGMVGLVVGSAGRLKEEPNGFTSNHDVNYRSLPSFRGMNGSVIGLEARNIAAMVAGAVERIAAIRVVSGIQITGGGVLGKDTNDLIDPAAYRDPDGNAIPEPVLDGRLVDGALVYQQFKPIGPGDKLPPSPRIFQLGQSVPKPKHT